MPHILDNMIWNAITTGDSDIDVLDGDVGSYRQDIAPFAGMKEFNDSNLQKIYEFISANRKVAISSLRKMDHDERKWKLIQSMNVTQMIYEYPLNTFITKNSAFIVPLTDGTYTTNARTNCID